MKHTLFILESKNGFFIILDYDGDKTLTAYETEEYYDANKFDSEEEVDTFLELFNSGKNTHPRLRDDWVVNVDPRLLPVNKRMMKTELF